MPDSKEVKVKDGRAIADALAIRQEAMDGIRAHMQAGFTQLGKELAGLRRTQPPQQAAQGPLSVKREEEMSIATDQMDDMPTPPFDVVLQPGAKLIINNNRVINTNVTIDLSTHSTVEANRVSSNPVSCSISADGILDSLTKAFGGLFKS